MSDLENMEKRIQETMEIVNRKSVDDSDYGHGINDDFVMECLNNNEQGDGALFIKIGKNLFVYNKSMDYWVVWVGHHWEIDKLGRAEAAVVEVSDIYRAAGKRRIKKAKNLTKLAAAGGEMDEKQIKKLFDDGKELLQRAKGLRGNKRRKNCLVWSHTQTDGMAVDGKEFDQKPYLFTSNNGIVQLKSGELEPGRPEDYLYLSSPVDYLGIDADCSLWEKTLNEIFPDAPEKISFLQRLFGYTLIGEVRESIFVVLSGRGRNGKSLIIEVVSSVLGQMAGAIRSEMLLDSGRVANPSAPSPEVVFLKGLRFAFASETDSGRKFSPARIKYYSGGDTLTGRNTYDKFPVQFPPSHTLYLSTNDDPVAPADDYAFWERLIRIQFEISFVDREPENENERRADPHLMKKLKQNLPGILGWLVKGCLEYQRIGLNPPACVLASVEAYRQDMDTMGEFISDCCLIDDGYRTKAADIYTVFEKWWEKNISNRVPKMHWFGKRFGKRFEKEKSGVVWYLGVKISPHAYESMDIFGDNQ